MHRGASSIAPLPVLHHSRSSHLLYLKQQQSITNSFAFLFLFVIVSKITCRGSLVPLCMPQALQTNVGLLKLKGSIRTRAIACHGRIPGLRKLPFPAVGIIVALILANVLVWVAVAIVLHYHAALVSTAVLSYTLGLRHALDADHISVIYLPKTLDDFKRPRLTAFLQAIDLMTRRLVASGQCPVTVGTFFSLGHSTYAVQL